MGPRALCSTICCFLLLLAATCDAQRQELEKVIDGCAQIRKQSAVNNNTNDRRQVAIIVATTDSHSSTIHLGFKDCRIPNNMDITIVVQPQPSGQPAPPKAVRVEVVNTTMQGGSLQIVPVSNHTDVPCVMQSIHVHVANATLEGPGDIFVVNTTASPIQLVEDILMEFEDVVLRSSSGSAASIVTRPLVAGSHRDGVSHAHIRIEKNSTIQARYLVASLETSMVFNSSLVVAVHTCVDLVRLAAGDKSVKGHVGVLSIVAHSGVLHVEDVHILVHTSPPHNSSSLPGSNISIPSTSPCASLYLVASARSGVAVTAGITLRDPHNAKLTMTGCVIIEVALHGAAPVESIQPQQTQANAAPAVALNATVSHHYSAATVGGVVLLAHQDDGVTQSSKLFLDNCSLHLSLTVSSIHHNIVLKASAGGLNSGLSVFGLAFSSVARGPQKQKQHRQHDCNSQQ